MNSKQMTTAMIGFVAVNQNGTVWIYESRPTRFEGEWFGSRILTSANRAALPEAIQNITWDDDPVMVDIVLDIECIGTRNCSDE